MVEHSLDMTFRALADPTRRAILVRLKDGPKTVSDLAKPFEMSLAATSKHIGVLEQAQLVQREKQGRERLCHLRAEQLRSANEWLSTYAAFWTERLDALEAALREELKE